MGFLDWMMLGIPYPSMRIRGAWNETTNDTCDQSLIHMSNSRQQAQSCLELQAVKQQKQKQNKKIPPCSDQEIPVKTVSTSVLTHPHSLLSRETGVGFGPVPEPEISEDGVGTGGSES